MRSIPVKSPTRRTDNNDLVLILLQISREKSHSELVWVKYIRNNQRSDFLDIAVIMDHPYKKPEDSVVRDGAVNAYIENLSDVSGNMVLNISNNIFITGIRQRFKGDEACLYANQTLGIFA